MSLIPSTLLAVALVVAAAPALAAGTAGENGLPKSLLDDNADSNSAPGTSGGATYRVDQPAYRQAPASPPGTMRLDLGTPGSGVTVPLPAGSTNPAPDLPAQPNPH
jgi:hypothetical protein